MTILFPIFLNNHGNSAVVLQHAWHAGAGNTVIHPIMIHAMAEWYLRGDFDKIREHGEVFIVSLIKVLNQSVRVPFMMEKDSVSIPKTAQLQPQTVIDLRSIP